MQNDSPCVPLSLCDAGIGTLFKVCGLDGTPATCQRLREMGFCENAQVEKISHRHLLICAVCGVRMALDRATARGILVEALPTT